MFKVDDVKTTLEHLGILRYTATTAASSSAAGGGGGYVLVCVPEQIEKEWQRLNAKPGPRVDAERIHWVPAEVPVTVKKDKWLFSTLKKELEREAGADADDVA